MTDTAGPQFILGGRTEPGSSPLYQGMYGYYWSSSAYADATYAYYLYLDGDVSAVGSASNGYKRVGFSLRCLAQ